ncbi:hypothetical protein ACFXKR_09170 [Streptomyces violascens]|uniref:hypothetical protein n=1 Tax=Streptomyces violascens TaxID=67381 RepID=UPI003699DE12
MEDVTARRRQEIADVVEWLAPGQRAALVDALSAFAEAGGEPAAPDEVSLCRLGWSDSQARRTT